MLETMRIWLEKALEFFTALGLNLVQAHQQLVQWVGLKPALLLHLMVGVFLLAILFRILRLTLNFLKFVILPSVLVGLFISLFFSISLLSALPLAGGLFSLLFLLRS